MLNNLRLSTRLTLGFLLIVLLTAAVGAIGIRNLGQLDVMNNMMYEKDLLAIASIKQANIDLVYIDRGWRRMLISSSIEERTGARKRIDENIGKLQSNLEDVRARLSTEKGRALLAKTEKEFSTYLGLTTTLLANIEKERLYEKSTSLAREIEPVLAQSKVLDDTFEALTKNKEERAKTTLEESAATYHASFNMMLGLIAGAAILGGLLGFYVTRSVTRPLGEAVKVAEALARGDISIQAASAAKDETGDLLRAMGKMVAALRSVITETQSVVAAAAQGDLTKRITLDDKQGFAKELGSSVNSYSDTCGTIMKDMGLVLDAMASGDMSKRIQRDYQG